MLCCSQFTHWVAVVVGQFLSHFGSSCEYYWENLAHCLFTLLTPLSENNKLLNVWWEKLMCCGYPGFLTPIWCHIYTWHVIVLPVQPMLTGVMLNRCSPHKQMDTLDHFSAVRSCQSDSPGHTNLLANMEIYECLTNNSHLKKKNPNMKTIRFFSVLAWHWLVILLSWSSIHLFTWPSIRLTIHPNCFLLSPPHRQMDALNSFRKWLHVHPVGQPRSVGQNLLAWDHPYSHWVTYHTEYIDLICYQRSNPNHKGCSVCKGESVSHLNTSAHNKESNFLILRQITLWEYVLYIPHL